MHTKKCPHNVPEFFPEFKLTVFCVNIYITVVWNMILLVLGTCQFYFSYTNLPHKLSTKPWEIYMPRKKGLFQYLMVHPLALNTVYEFSRVRALAGALYLGPVTVTSN